MYLEPATRVLVGACRFLDAIEAAPLHVPDHPAGSFSVLSPSAMTR